MALSARRAQQEGRIRLHPRFPSRYLSTPRDIIVYLPPGYGEADRRYPVLYLQDGQNLFDPRTAFGGQDWNADITADGLIDRGTVEPLIMVGIYNTGVRRISEYTPTRDRHRNKGGKGARYARMIAHELKPFVDKHYATRRGRTDTGVGGSSLGGLVSLEAGLLYPGVFGKLAVVSPSVWWDHAVILKRVSEYQARTHARIWLDTGTQEGDSPQNVVHQLRMLRHALEEKGWQAGSNLHYVEVPGAQHNEWAWAARFGAILEYLFPARPGT